MTRAQTIVTIDSIRIAENERQLIEGRVTENTPRRVGDDTMTRELRPTRRRVRATNGMPEHATREAN